MKNITNFNEALEYINNISENYKSFSDFNTFETALDLLEKSKFNNYSKEIIKKYFKSIEMVGGILNRVSNYQYARIIYQKTQIHLHKSHKIGAINCIQKNSFQIMLIKTYANTGDEMKALLQSDIVLSHFFKNKKLFQKECKTLDFGVNKEISSYSYLILCLQDLARFAKSICNRIGDNKSSSKFYYIEKKLELLQHLRFIENKPSQFLIRNEHSVSFSHDMNYIFQAASLSNKAWNKKPQFIIKMIMKNFISLCSFLIWGFGEKPKRIIGTIITTIIFFTGLYFLKCSESIFTSFKFSTAIIVGAYSVFSTSFPIDKIEMYVISEQALGLILTALFIFVLGRKVGR